MQEQLQCLFHCFPVSLLESWAQDFALFVHEKRYFYKLMVKNENVLSVYIK